MISKRIQNMTPSATTGLIGKIAELRAVGTDIIGFNAGEPDFATPEVITQACLEAMREGKTTYVGVEGVMPLRKAIVEKLRADNGIAYDPKQITVSTGAKQALFNAVMAICNPGDEVIIPTPCWVSYVEIVKLAQGVPVLVPTHPDYTLNLGAIKKAVTGRTRAIIINSPNNPTGAVYSAEALAALGGMAVEHDFYVVSDEVYEKLIYDGNAHISIAGVSPETYGKTITINGFSKTYCMTGWRLGYSAAPQDVCTAINALQSHTTSNSTTFVQWAGIAALEKCAGDVERMRTEFNKRRDYMKGRLDAIPGVACVRPGGAFYLMPDVSCCFGKSDGKVVVGDSVDFCEYVLGRAGVAIVPGAAFEMPNTVRFSYSTSMENIQNGMDRFEEAVRTLR